MQDNLPLDYRALTPALVFAGKWDPEWHLSKIKAQIAMYETRVAVP